MLPESWRRIDELYHRASDLGPADRARFLDDADRGDEEVWHEVESLLAQSGGTLLEHPAWQARGLKTGVRLGPYEIVAKLGEGGMGVVYRATDTKLNWPVAIKLLSDQLADAAARRRFQREAQASALEV